VDDGVFDADVERGQAVVQRERPVIEARLEA